MTRTKMKVYTARLKAEDPAGSLQAQIEEIEKKGHYVMQYVQLNAFDGMILAHDYPDKKEKEPAPAVVEQTEPEAPEAPAGEPAVIPDQISTRVKDGLPTPAKKGKHK